MHVVAAEIFVLSRAHVPLGSLQVPADDSLNSTTYPVPLPLHDTSTPPDVMVLATADTADAVPDAEVVVDVGEGDAGTSALMTGALLSGALLPEAPPPHAARTVTVDARSAAAAVHLPAVVRLALPDRAFSMCSFPSQMRVLLASARSTVFKVLPGAKRALPCKHGVLESL